MILFDIKADLYGPPSNGCDDSRFQARLAVATVFDQIEPLQAQLTRIASFREPMQRLCDLAKVFEPFREFELRVVDLARVLEPMQIFQDQLRQVMNQFAPLEASRSGTQTALRVVRRTFERTRRIARTGGYAPGPTRAAGQRVRAGENSSRGILRTGG